MYLNVGTPGRSNDSTIFEKSSLKRELNSCQLLKEMSRTLSNVSVPICILGDSAFKLSSHLMKPFPFSTTQTIAERNFNYSHSKCRRVVENFFGHLKARFRRIGKGLDNDIDNTNMIIKACCILHNFLNENNDHINQIWLQENEAFERTRQYPPNTALVADNHGDAQQIRNAIASFLGEKIFFIFFIYLTFPKLGY